MKWNTVVVAMHMWYPSRPVCPACTCYQLSRRLRLVSSRLGFGWRLATSLIPLDARSHHSLIYPESVDCTPQRLSQSTRSSRPPMEALGATSAVVGLAIPVFKCAKELRDKIKLVRPLSSEPSVYHQSAHDYSISIFVFAGRIGESGALGSAHRIRKGYQPPRVTLQQQQGAIGPARTRHRPEGACRVRVVLASRSPCADGPDTTTQNPTRPR